MITEAIVIGAIDAAVFWEDEHLRAVRLGSAGDELIDCSRDVGLLLSAGAEKRRLAQPPQDLGELQEQLLEWSQRHRALSMMISGLDPQLTRSTRLTCILAADQSLCHPSSAAFARARLLGCALPEEADLKGALGLAFEGSANRAAALYGDLSKGLPYVAKVRERLERLLRYEFDDGIDPESALRALIDSGAVADAVDAIVQRYKPSLEGLFFKYLRAPEIAPVLPRAGHLLARFIAEIRGAYEWEDLAAAVAATPADVIEMPQPNEDPFFKAVENWRGDLASQSGRQRHQPPSYDAFKQVEGQKAFIVDTLEKNKLGRAENAILALIRSQRRYSTLAQMCKSLCDLGASATRLGQFEFAMRLYRVARIANVADVVPFTGYAETLRQMGRLEEALAAYREAKAAFSHEVVPFNGYAETLRQLGWLEEALAAYGDAKAAFPHEAVPANGYAETLRQMGQLEEALAAYGDAKAAFPHDVYAPNGYAETLRQMGRLEEALAAYREAKAAFSHEVVPFNGYAETLRQLGWLEEALAAYGDAKAAFPHEAVPANGYAETLRQMGQLEEALAAYREAKAAFPHDVYAHNGYAETLRQMGRLEEALAAYGEAKAAFSHKVVPFNGYAETLRQMGRLEEALAAYRKAKAAFSHEVVSFSGYAETLRQLGWLEEALAAYREAKAAFSHDVVPFTGYAETLRQMGRLEEAEGEFRSILTQFPNERVAKNALACLLIDKGQTAAARALISVQAPKTEQDWRDYHVAAMAFLKEKNYDEAEKRLAHAAHSAPFHSAREVFRTGLAFAKLRRQLYPEVSSLTRPENVLEFRRPAVAVMDAHASAALGDLDRAEKSLRDAERSQTATVVSLSDFMRKRYGLGRYSEQVPDGEEAAALDEIIAEAEFDLALRAAA